MSLAIDEAAQMKNHTSRLIALAENGGIGVLQSCEFFLVAFALSLELFGNVLLEDKCFESIITLLLCAIETLVKSSSVILLLLDESREATILAFVSLNSDFELLCLFGKLFSESLEFEELPTLSVCALEYVRRETRTCCFQLSSSSTRKLFLLVTLVSSPSILPLRLIKSCHASMASLEY